MFSRNKKRKFNQLSFSESNIDSNTESNTNMGEKPNKARRIYEEAILGNPDIYTIGNEVHFSASITKDTIEELIRQVSVIVYAHQQKHKNSSDMPELNIIYIVDSGGGSLTSTFKCIDFFNLLKEKHSYIKFTSICTGMVASAGTLLCAVADKCFITKNCHAMVHELSSSHGYSKYFQILSNVKFIRMLHKKLVKIYCNKTGKSVEEIEFLLGKEQWFSAKQYLKHGFVDAIK